MYAIVGKQPVRYKGGSNGKEGTNNNRYIAHSYLSSGRDKICSSNLQFYLGILYYHGRGVPQSFTQSANWYRRSAEQGNAEFHTGSVLAKEVC